MGVMTTHNSNKIYIYTSILSILGILVSFWLIREFYGTAGDFIGSLCTVSGSENGCEKVAQSSLSGFRNLPFLGDIPIALFGFILYGMILGISYIGIKDNNGSSGSLRLIFSLAVLAFIADIILFSLMVFVIQTICPLCITTYFITILLLVFSFMELKRRSVSMNPLNDETLSYLKNNGLNYLIFILFFLTCGIAGGRYNSGATTIASQSDGTIIQKKIEVYEKSPILNIDLVGIPFAGDEKAPIVIVKFADFNCGHCMHTSLILRQILQEYSGIVKIYYKNFPLDGNCNTLMTRKSPDGSSCIAASASICANQQKKFKPIYEELYSDTERGIRHSSMTVLEIAKKQNLNIPTFNACMNSVETRDSINRDVLEAGKLNITSTPSLYINNKAIDPGTPDPIFLRALINHLTKKI